MKLAKIFITLLLIVIFCAILYGFMFSSFSEDGKALLNITWGVISLIDIYIMFTLFSLWVLYREGFNVISIIIVITVMLLGSLTATLYTLYTLLKSNGDWKIFWMGRRRSQLKQKSK